MVFQIQKDLKRSFWCHNEFQKIIISESGVTIGMNFFRIDRAAYSPTVPATSELTPNSAWLSLEKKNPPVDNETDIFRGT